jgi:hypothetical protein
MFGGISRDTNADGSQFFSCLGTCFDMDMLAIGGCLCGCGLLTAWQPLAKVVASGGGLDLLHRNRCHICTSWKMVVTAFRWGTDFHSRVLWSFVGLCAFLSKAFSTSQISQCATASARCCHDRPPAIRPNRQGKTRQCLLRRQRHIA